MVADINSTTRVPGESSGGSRISREAPAPEGVRQSIIGHKSCRKLHENERNLTERGRVLGILLGSASATGTSSVG